MGASKSGQDENARAAFTMLPDGGTRWWSFLAAGALEFGIALLVVAIAPYMPQRLVPASRLSFMPLFVAPVTEWRPPPSRVPVMLPRLLPARAPVAPARAPVIAPKPVRLAEAPMLPWRGPELRAPSFQPAAPLRPRPGIRTGVLPGSAAPRSLPRTPAKVQTGGFGDPYGVPATGDASRAMTINPAGSFDMPAGRGSGNGTGGSQGARGVIASAGFGNGVASPGEGGSGPGQGAIRAGVFGDARPRSGEAARPAARPPGTPAVEPVEILEKPDPVYPAAARALRIEGDVVLDVVFAATGEVRVLRVVRGLGHGLDEAAIAAARRIRFRPQRKNGEPVDCEARLRIVFRLAY
jgi:TonB family protein